MKEYLNLLIFFLQLYKSSFLICSVVAGVIILFFIIQKIRKRKLYKSKRNSDDNEFTITNNDYRDTCDINSSFHEKNVGNDIKCKSSIELEESPTETELNKEIENTFELYHDYNDDVNEIDVDDIKCNNDEDIEVETQIIKKNDLNEISKTTIKEISDEESTDRNESTLSQNDLFTNNSVQNRKFEIISNDTLTIRNKQPSSILKKRRITCKNVLVKDIDELLQKINRIFNEHKLLGNYDCTEDEYSTLLEKVGLLCKSLLSYGNVFETKHHKLVFITLVEIAKRWKDFDNEDDVEESSHFWDYISRHLINEDNINPKLYHAFTDVISQLEIDVLLPVVSKGKKYYSTLMMHSFSPKSSIYSFYDLCFTIYKRDLDFGFTKEDEWQCERFALKIASFLDSGYREDKKVTIGSSVYSIKIGLRSFALNEDLLIDFVYFIKDALYKINRLFYREPISTNTRLERYIVEWWNNKIESEKVSDDTPQKRRVPTVSKDNIVAKYIREDNSVFLCIPSVRLDDENNKLKLKIFVNEVQIHSEEIKTKRGELVVTTKHVELELNDLLNFYDNINLRVEIEDNSSVVFDSERNKATSLNREFILFEGEKEILSHINKPTNYFVYSKNIDTLRKIPDELTTYGPNLYNIYPIAGESISGEIKQVFFIDKTKNANIGKIPCLIGEIQNVEWVFNDVSCIVYSDSVKLLIPEDFNLKSLELRIGSNAYKLQYLNIEKIESGCYQFGLRALDLITDNHPTEINLYSYDKELTILSEKIIVLPNLELQFNHSFYYGDVERKLSIRNGGEAIEFTWSNQDNEIRCPFNDGMLLMKIAYLRWRINNNEWHSEPINRKLWYKDFLVNGDILEIDNPNENDDITILGKINGESFEIVRNQNGNFEIGRAIYANENITDISVNFILGKEMFEIFTVSTKEHFIANPLTYNDGKVFWNPEDTFIGDESNEFFLIIKSADNNFQSKIDYKKREIKNLHNDRCIIQVKNKDKNIFSKAENYQLIFEGELLIGKEERLITYLVKYNIGISTIAPFLEKKGFSPSGGIKINSRIPISYLSGIEAYLSELDKVNQMECERLRQEKFNRKCKKYKR